MNVQRTGFSLSCLAPGTTVVFLLAMLLLLASCREGGQDEPVSAVGRQEVFRVDGKEVPIFPTAAEQFNYTRSWFSDSGDKRAALQAFLALHARSRICCGMAALDLAYLELGDDYRLAGRRAAEAALAAYAEVARQYADSPEILAKAYWYIGWIHADLLHDPATGLQYFRTVVDAFPDERIVFMAPAPWVSILAAEGSGSDTSAAPSVNTWAALALLEIMRHTSDAGECQSAFEALWEGYRHDGAMGFALRLVLAQRPSAEAAAVARQFLEKHSGNAHLLHDIRRLLQDASRPEEQSLP